VRDGRRGGHQVGRPGHVPSRKSLFTQPHRKGVLESSPRGTCWKSLPASPPDNNFGTDYGPLTVHARRTGAVPCLGGFRNT
jgi:hypothetical protein